MQFSFILAFATGRCELQNTYSNQDKTKNVLG